jgi:tol-pal system protein YbgF
LLITACLAVMPLAGVYAQAPVSNPEQQGGSIEQRLERVERMLQSQGLVSMLRQLQELQRELSNLRGEIETQNYNLEQLTRRQRDLYADIDQRLQRLEGTGAAVSGELPTAPPTTGTPEAPPLETLSAIQGESNTAGSIPSTSPLQVEIINAPPARAENATPGSVAATVAGSAASPAAPATPIAPSTPAPTPPASTDPVQLQAEYQQAFNLLRQSLYDQAIKAFQQYLVAHPNDRYSDSAQYWLAEAYYVKREFEPALAEYQKVIINFPQSQKAGDAMLKAGFTLAELGQHEAAKKQLEELVQKFPETTVARMAEERLKQVNLVLQQSPPAAE